MTNDRAYWKSRAKWRQAAYDRAGDKVIATVLDAYGRAYRQTRDDVAKIVETYARDKNMTQTAAMKMLQENAGRGVIERLREEAAAIADPAKRAEIVRRLDASYYAGRISRKEAIMEAARVQLSAAADVQIAATEKLLMKSAADAFARTAFDVQRVAGYGFDLSGVSLRRVQSALKTTWSGQQFSARVWKNTETAARLAQKTVVENILSGKAAKETWDALVKESGSSVMAANRIMRTEMNYVTGQAEMEAFKDAEIDKYRFTVVFDGRVCERCAEMDGRVFAVSDQRVGVNMHPLHPFCRCGVEPILPFETEGGERWARRISDGQEEKISADISYGEWKMRFAKGAKK